MSFAGAKCVISVLISTNNNIYYYSNISFFPTFPLMQNGFSLAVVKYNKQMCAFFLLIKLWGRLHVQITHLQREILNGTNGKEEAIEKETSNARKKERKIC